MNIINIVNGEMNIKRLEVINIPFDESKIAYVVSYLINEYNSKSFEMQPFTVGNIEDPTLINNSSITISYPFTERLLDLKFELNLTNKFKPSEDVFNYLKNLFT